MDHDDRPIGRILTRREAMGLLGLTGSALLAACMPDSSEPTGRSTDTSNPTAEPELQADGAQTQAAGAGDQPPAAAEMPACVVRPEMAAGPFFFDLGLQRADIRSEPSDGSERPGRRLDLQFFVTSITTGACTPLPGAVIDVWHCDADGVYSGTGAASSLGFLRGNQETDAGGSARFTTIYPGWYPGRAVHIHFKIRVPESNGGVYDFTSQLFFDEAFTAGVYGEAPYAARGLPNTPNGSDGIFRNGGDLLTLDVAETDGILAARFDIGLDLT